MNKFYPNLFAPLRIRNLRLKNRIIAAPTSMMDLTSEGKLTDRNILHYELKARGGAAVVTMGESIPDPATGQSHNRQIRLDDPESLPNLRNYVVAIHNAGALANIELSHGGKFAGLPSIGGDELGDRIAYGPSDEVVDGIQVREMPKEIIHHIVKAYGEAADLCRRAGFDMVMVHAAHGWLFNQFLSPRENHRTDEYGGSLENRARFLMEALDAVRAAVGNMPIELRMNGDDFREGGMHLEDYVELAKLLESRVDLINVSCGAHDGDNLFVRTHPSSFLERGCNVYLAAEIKKAVSIPVACVGAIGTPEHAEEILASGQADLVEMARGLIADPYFPKKAQCGNAADITPCLRCFHCLASNTDRNAIACAVNPVIGAELDNKFFTPKPQPKTVLVVGGGPGGMEAAITAARLGHTVTLCEATDSLGGALKFARHVPFKHDLWRLSQCLERRVRAENIDLRLNTPVDAAFVSEMAPDVVIAAIGAEPIVPPIPGIDHEKVQLAAGCEEKAEELGENIAILGGGLIGSETALALAAMGKKVTVIEMRDTLYPEANQFHRMGMENEFKRLAANITELPGHRAVEIGDAGVCVMDKDGRSRWIAADTVLLAAGMRPKAAVADALADAAQEAYLIGDCSAVGQVSQAMNQGYYIAREL